MATDPTVDSRPNAAASRPGAAPVSMKAGLVSPQTPAVPGRPRDRSMAPCQCTHGDKIPPSLGLLYAQPRGVVVLAGSGGGCGGDSGAATAGTESGASSNSSTRRNCPEFPRLGIDPREMKACVRTSPGPEYPRQHHSRQSPSHLLTRQTKHELSWNTSQPQTTLTG